MLENLSLVDAAEIISAVGVVFALWFAYRANAAARDAVNATLDTGKAQTRAYLGVTEVTYLSRENRFEVSVAIQNAGNSPASNISLKGKIFWRDTYKLNIGTGESSGGDLISSDLQHYFISDIPPGSFGRGGFTLSSDAQVVAKIHSKSISPVRIRCTLKWDDVFGESQDIRFELLGFRYNEAEENERGHKGKLRIEWQWGNDPDGFVSSEEPEDTV